MLIQFCIFVEVDIVGSGVVYQVQGEAVNNNVRQNVRFYCWVSYRMDGQWYKSWTILGGNQKMIGVDEFYNIVYEQVVIYMNEDFC